MALDLTISRRCCLDADMKPYLGKIDEICESVRDLEYTVFVMNDYAKELGNSYCPRRFI